MSRTVIGSNGITPLELAKQIQQENQEVPLVAHIRSAPPYLSEILTSMEREDVLARCFNGKESGILDQATDRIKNFVWQAYNEGVIFDVGHGTDSFDFHVTETALRKGMKAALISTDICIRNRGNGPVYDLVTTMEKLHVVGYDRPEITEKVTKAPVENFHLAQKGTLEIGKGAGLTILTVQAEEETLTDSNKLTRTAKEQIRPIRTIIGGQIYDNQLRKTPLRRSY